jgi:hypothetical protein
MAETGAKVETPDKPLEAESLVAVTVHLGKGSSNSGAEAL